MPRQIHQAVGQISLFQQYVEFGNAGLRFHRKSDVVQREFTYPYFPGNRFSFSRRRGIRRALSDRQPDGSFFQFDSGDIRYGAFQIDPVGSQTEMPDTGVQAELRQRIGIIHRRPVEPETMYDDFAAQQRPQGDVRLESGTVGHRIQHRGRHHHVVDDQP